MIDSSSAASKSNFELDLAVLMITHAARGHRRFDRGVVARPFQVSLRHHSPD
jgi:hypothetical protein